MRVVIKGAGDIASGIALRLWRAGLRPVMTDLPEPSSIRRTVCFSEAVRLGETRVEDIVARRAESPAQALELLRQGILPVLADPEAECIRELRPEVVVDAILAKVNTGTAITDAPAVIAVGPGFTAGTDCHAVVETKRGHTLGRVIVSGSAIANTGVPGLIGGYAAERVMHSENAGIFRCVHAIGDAVEAGETVAYVGEIPVKAKIPGILRGLLPEGFSVPRAGFKCADVDPRGNRDHCFTASDKAIAVGGGVLEAALSLTGVLRKDSEA